MNKFVVAGDNHLRKTMWQKKPNLHSDAYVSFNQLIEYCLENKYPLVLAGDLFDSDQPQPDDIAVFETGATKMAAAGLKVFYIQGQHEYKKLPWAVAINCGVEYVGNADWHTETPITFEPVPGFTMYGLNRLSREELKEALAHVPDNVQGLVLHQWEKSSFPFPDSWNLDLEWVPRHVKLVALGDYHVKIDLKWDTGIGFYTGSQHLTEVSEDPEKSFVVVTVGDDITYERVPLQTRAYKYMQAYSAEELDKVVATLDKETEDAYAHLDPIIRKPIFVVEYLTSIDGAGPRIRAAAGDKVHLFLKPVITKEQHWGDKKNISADEEDGDVVTLAGVIEAVAAQGTAEYRFVHDLATKPNVKDVLSHWREEYHVST